MAVLETVSAVSPERPEIGAVFAAVPGALEGLRAIRRAVEATGIDLNVLELAFLRASQINGCAYCVGYHVADARRRGVPDRKLHLLAAWRDTDEFDVTEKAVLAYAEAVTRIDQHEASFASPAARVVVAVLGEQGLHQLTLALAYINAWNRIGAVYQFSPPGGF